MGLGDGPEAAHLDGADGVLWKNVRLLLLAKTYTMAMWGSQRLVVADDALALEQALVVAVVEHVRSGGVQVLQHLKLQHLKL